MAPPRGRVKFLVPLGWGHCFPCAQQVSLACPRQNSAPEKSCRNFPKMHCISAWKSYYFAGRENILCDLEKLVPAKPKKASKPAAAAAPAKGGSAKKPAAKGGKKK